MAGIRKVVYLDACIFIAMITGEERKGTETFDIAGLAQAIERKEVVAVTSTLSRVEVLDCTLTNQQKGVLRKIMAPPKMLVKAPDMAIMDMAHDIRDFYQKRRIGGETLPTVETPDAIHLATAIYWDCDVLYTVDETDVPDGTGKRPPKRGLIPLSGLVADRWRMLIDKPRPSQHGMPF